MNDLGWYIYITFSFSFNESRKGEISTVMLQKGENNMNENNECLVMGNCGMASLLIVGLLIGIIFVCIML